MKAEKHKKVKPMIGAYYFDGWSGRSKHAEDAGEPWARQAPTHLSRRMIEEFHEREPVWGWRDDSMEIMELQIDLAVDNGLGFFAFCWYWSDNCRAINKQAIKDDPLHTSMELYLKAKNNHKLKFCLLVANHQGAEIKGTENWKQAADFWMPYLKHPQCVTADGKPLLIIYNPNGGDKEGFAYLQETARREGLPGVAIAGCMGRNSEIAGYTHRTAYVARSEYVGGEKNYAQLMKSSREAWMGSRKQPFMPILMAGWDCRPWEGTGFGSPTCYYPDRTPEQFAVLLHDACRWMNEHPEQTTAEHVALIYAWNEFGEGGYIAPTKGDPDGKYLSAIRDTVDYFGSASAKKPLAEIRWAGSFCEIYDECGRCFAELRSTGDLEVTVSTGFSKDEVTVSSSTFASQALDGCAFRLKSIPVKLEASDVISTKAFIDKLKRARVEFQPVSLLMFRLFQDKDKLTATAILQNNTDGILSGSLELPELAGKGHFSIQPNQAGSFNMIIGAKVKELPSDAVLGVKLEGHEGSLEFPVKSLVPSKICKVGRNGDSKEWIGKEHRAFFRAFQDGETLHLSVDVKDDSPTGSPALEPWEQDCVELFFDAAPDGSVTKYDGNVGRLFIMPRLPEGKMLKVWPGDLKLSVRDVAVKVVQTADGYTAEIGIPLAFLLLNGTLEGRSLGFDIQIDDMKDKKKNMFFWSSQGTAFSNRSTFGVLVFE